MDVDQVARWCEMIQYQTTSEADVTITERPDPEGNLYLTGHEIKHA